MHRVLTTIGLLVGLILAGCVNGCAALKANIPTTAYTAKFCARGSVPFACRDLGTVNVPEGGAAFVELVLAVAGPLLQQQTQLKGCLLTTYPAVVDGTVTVTATAVCTLNGVPAQEDLTVTLTPVVSPPAAS